MRTIGPYDLLTRVGSGNLGDVFLAQPDDREGGAAEQLAVKVIRQELVQDLKFSRVLLAEAPAAIAFEHPSAIDVRAVERAGNDAYVAMELVYGQPLSVLIQRARVDGERIDHRIVSWIGAQLASALHAAHRIPWFPDAPAMMAHGALAPRSVFLGYDGSVRLFGIGLGRARAVVPMTLARLPYSAPERVKGSDPNPRSDVFSLGTLLYEAFCGRNIFRRANEEDTRAAVRDANAPPLNSTNLDVDPSIGDLLAQMMAPRIDARPESLEEVSQSFATAAGPVEPLQMQLAVLMKRTFQAERDAGARLVGAATRAQSAANATRPRAASGVGAVAPTASDPDLDIPIAEGTPVPELADWSTDPPASNTVVRVESPAIDTANTVEDVIPEDVRAAILAGQAVTAPMEAVSRSPQPMSGPRPGGDDVTYDVAERRRVSRYRIESVVARSATSVMFLARDPNVGREVLVKALDPAFITDARLSRDEWVRLFKREARIAGQIAHPNIPTVLDAGRDDTVFFLVREHAKGETLAQLMHREAVMSQQRVREIVVEVAEALAHLHDRGVVHCDVRPSNVVLEHPDVTSGSANRLPAAHGLEPSGRVRLIDLSMAARIEGSAHPLLASNAMTLSPEYLDGHGYGPSSDQFALGMLLYQMLVGSRPFKGLDDAALVHAIRTKAPRAPEEIESHVNPILSEMCMRMLEKDPARRYESCAAIAERLSGSQIPKVDALTPKNVDLVDSSPTDQNQAVAPMVSVESMSSAFVAVCERISTLTTQPFAEWAGGDPADAARAVARRLVTDETTEVLATLAAALRDLADRLRVSISSEEMMPLIPAELAPVLRTMQQMSDGVVPEPPVATAAEIAFVVEAYYAATRPRGGSARVSPRRAVLALKNFVGKQVRAEVVEALVEHLREMISALDLAPTAADAPKVLVAGRVASDALVHALEFDGFLVEEATDGHAAWEKLRHHGYAGAVLDAGLAGRDGVSLVRLCRAHPDTAAIRFVLVGPGGDLDSLRPDPAVRMVRADAAVDQLRAEVGRLLEARRGA